MPLVFYDRICTGINCSRVVVDDYMGAYNAVTHLINTGCRRIACYSSPMTLEISKTDTTATVMPSSRMDSK